MAGAYGVFNQLGMGAASPVTEAFEFLTDSLRCYETILDAGGISGTRSRRTERHRVTRRDVNGTITMNPNPVELDRMLPRILGAAEAADVFALAESLPEFYVTSDRVTKVLTYNGCKINRATFSAADGQPLNLSMDIVGKDETVGNAGTFPAITPNEASPPFILPDLAFTIAATPYTVDGLTITVDNALDVRFGNSLTATEINPTNRLVTVSARVPWGDAGALYATGSPGVAMTATFTNGAVSVLFTMAAVRFPKSTPVVDGQGEEWLPIEGVALMTGSTRELVVTNDSAP